LISFRKLLPPIFFSCFFIFYLSKIGAFRELVDVNLLCALGPPGGGRNPVTSRFTRHFNLISFCEMEDVSKQRIFSTILQSWLGR